MLQGGRVMHLAALAFIAGLLTLRWLPVLPSTLWLTVSALLALLLLRSRYRVFSYAALGICWACFNAHSALQDQLKPELDGRTLWVEGTVVGLPEWPLVHGQPPTVRFELHNATSRRTQL